MERSSASDGVARAELHGRIHAADRLAATATRSGADGRCADLKRHRHRVLMSEFANILRDLVIPQPILEWLADAVLTSDHTEQAARAEAIKKLQARYDQIETRIGIMYMDKLDGRITQEFFDKQAATLRRAGWSVMQDRRYPEGHAGPSRSGHQHVARDEPCERVVPPATRREQRRLLQVVVEKASWKDGALQTALFEAFGILRHSNRESHRKENENAGFANLAPRSCCTGKPLALEMAGHHRGLLEGRTTIKALGSLDAVFATAVRVGLLPERRAILGPRSAQSAARRPCFHMDLTARGRAHVPVFVS